VRRQGQVMKIPTIIKQEPLVVEAGVSKLARVWFARNPLPVLLKEPVQFWNQNFIANEAHLLGGISHPHVRRRLLYDALTHRLFLEFVEATTLQELVLSGATQQDPRRAHEILQSVAETMADLHEGIWCDRPVVHNDLKSLNVLVPTARAGGAVLIDFSHSYFEGQMPPFIADHQHNPTGTIKYMAPEKWDGDLEHGRQSDVFAFGVLAYYAYTGRFPFEGDANEVAQQAHAATPPTPIQLGLNVLRNMQAVMMSCLEKQPNRRPSMEQVARCYAETANLLK
jgi:serine/threonine-protein kinase